MPDMPQRENGAYNDLSRSMEKALELLGLLTELSGRKSGCLTAGDIEGLRSAMENEEEIIAALNDTEKDRMIKADALSQAIGLFTKNAPLKALVEALPDRAAGEKLRQLGERLGAAMAALSDKNGKLKELLQLQINCNDYMLNMLVIPKHKGNAYDVRGSRRDDAAGRGFLDVHI
jgi:flagellar biosynthesis/type III secretory pathway chaperone